MWVSRGASGQLLEYKRGHQESYRFDLLDEELQRGCRFWFQQPSCSEVDQQPSRSCLREQRSAPAKEGGEYSNYGRVTLDPPTEGHPAVTPGITRILDSLSDNFHCINDILTQLEAN